MANLKRVLLSDVQWYDVSTGTWKDVQAVSPSTGETAVSLGVGGSKAILYTNSTPINMPTELTQSINWADFEIYLAADTHYSIFGASLGRITVATKSPLLRYHIETTVYTTEDVVTTNSTWHYMMTKASFASNAFTGAGGTSAATDTTTTTSIKFWFPAITAGITNATAVAAQAALLQTISNWKIYVLRPDGSTKEYTPSSITLGSPDTGTATDYGSAKISVSLSASISYPTDGSYVITVAFTSNDQDPAFAIAGSQAITANVTMYTGSTQQYIVSSDSDVSVTIAFAQA